jgi:hypothetical protein
MNEYNPFSFMEVIRHIKYGPTVFLTLLCYVNTLDI